MTDREKLHDQAIEKLLLASLVYTPSLLLTDGIMPELFYTEIHRSFFKELIRIREDYGSVPSENLPIYLADKFQTLFVDVQGLASSANPTPEIKRLTELAERRRLITAAERAAADAANMERPVILPDDARPAWCAAQLSPQRFFDKPAPPFEFVVAGLLARGLTGFLFGEGGSYKSLAALWLVYQRAAAAVHCSGKWLDRFEITTPGRSIFFSAEDVDLDLHHRTENIVRAIASQRPDVPESAFQREIAENCLVIPREKWIQDGECFLVNENGMPTRKQREIIEIAKEFRADLLVIETFSRVVAVDEIDNAQASRAIGCLERIRDGTGATILCIAHSGKAARIKKDDVYGANGLRGASALLDNSRFGLWFRAQKRKDGADRLQIVNAKTFRCKRADDFIVKVTYPSFELVEDHEDAHDIFEQVIADVRQNPGAKQRETRRRIGANTAATSRAFQDAVAEERILLKSRKEGYFAVDEA